MTFGPSDVIVRAYPDCWRLSQLVSRKLACVVGSVLKPLRCIKGAVPLRDKIHILWSKGDAR
jgi:hypothetical protein